MKSQNNVVPKSMKYTTRNAGLALPTRSRDNNKSHGGKCLIIAGSRGFFGSAILCCLAASRCGAGYTYLSSSGKFPISRHPDFLMLEGHLNFADFNAVAIGPGYRNPKKLRLYLRMMEKQKIQNVVLDAEALNVIAQSPRQLPKSWLVTPHEGELSRILKVPSRVIRENRKKYLLLAQKMLGCVVLLKGYRTLVADEKSVWEIQSGNPALAKAGTGDVLTGMILSFMSQNLDSASAGKLAAHVHGLIADDWLKSGNDILSLLASDIVAMLPQALHRIRKVKSRRFSKPRIKSTKDNFSFFIL